MLIIVKCCEEYRTAKVKKSYSESLSATSRCGSEGYLHNKIISE
jgi:hypothetical protein